MGHEEAFVRSFIVKTKQDRYLQKLASPRHRRAFLSRLHHNLDYDSRFARQIPVGEQSVARILSLLRELVAPSVCHAITANSDLDGKELLLAKALDTIVGTGNGAILSCIPGQLAYYESEEQSRRFILERHETKPA